MREQQLVDFLGDILKQLRLDIDLLENCMARTERMEKENKLYLDRIVFQDDVTTTTGGKLEQLEISASYLRPNTRYRITIEQLD